MPQTQPCPQCSADNPVTKRFCADCGSPLSAPNAGPSHTESVIQTSPIGESFGWPQTEETQVVPRLEREISAPLPDLANCPQCHSSQTQSFEMAYSVSTSSGTTAGSAYTFGVGATIGSSRTVQQSNLAAYVRPPIQPTSTNGCLIAFVAFMGASVLATFARALFSGVSPDAQSGISAIVWIGSLIGIILLWMNSQKKQTEDKMVTYNNALDDWRRWWICLRCGHRWKR